MPLKKLNVLFENKTPVGTLVLDGSDAPFFQYATEWLEGGFELSPRWWPRRAELYPPNTEPETKWRLSPAFDLTYTDEGLDWVRERGRASWLFGSSELPRENIRRLAVRGNLTANEADNLIEEVLTAVSRWTEFAGAANVGKSTRQKITKAINTELTKFSH